MTKTNYEIECDNFDGDTYREHCEHEANARYDDVRERFGGQVNLEAEAAELTALIAYCTAK